MRTSRPQRAAAVLLALALAATGCDGSDGRDGPTEAPPPAAEVATCDDARAEATPEGFAAVAIETATNGGTAALADCAPGEPGEALAAAASALGALSLDQCRELPHAGGTSTFCWALDPEGESVTMRLKGAGASRQVAAAYRDGGPYAGVADTVFVAAVPELPVKPATVKAPGLGDPVAPQRFADDLFEGNTKTIIERCWTLSPEYIKSHFGTKAARGAVLQALRQPLQGAQTGVYAEGDHASVFFPWDEYDSNYPCPYASFEGVPSEPLPSDFAWEIHRLNGRIAGKPVHAYDTEKNYYLYCANDPGGYPGQDGRDRERAPTDTSKKAVNAALKQLKGEQVRVRRNDDMGLTLVFSAADPDAPMLVWYDVVGGHCLGDVWE